MVGQAGMVGLAHRISRSRAELQEFSANHHQGRLASGQVAFFFGYNVPGQFSHQRKKQQIPQTLFNNGKEKGNLSQSKSEISASGNAARQ